MGMAWQVLIRHGRFMLLSELSHFIRNHLHLKVPMDNGVYDIPRCINDVPEDSRVSFYVGVTFSNIWL